MEAARQESAVENDGASLRAGGGEKSAAKRYRAERIKFWNGYDRKPASAGYYRRLAQVYRYLIPPQSRVLELGCGTGDLLAALEPSLGVGVDFAPQMLKRAAQSHPKLRFIQGDVDQLSLKTKFDYVILSDLINDLWDVQAAIERVASVCTPSDSRDHQYLQPAMGNTAADGRAHGDLANPDSGPELVDAGGSRQHARARRLRGRAPVAGSAFSTRGAVACAFLQSLPGQAVAV